MPDPLDFAIDLSDVRTRLEGLRYFRSVTDILASVEALDGDVPAAPPAAFVGVAGEVAEPNRLIGGFAQRVNVSIAVLFVESALRANRQTRDQLENTRKKVTRILVASVPGNAERGLEYQRYRIVSIGNGLAWGEVSFATSYRLNT